VLYVGRWSSPRPGRCTAVKETRYPLRRRILGPQGQCGRVRKTPPPLGFDPRTVQPVASRYTNWAIQACKTCIQMVSKCCWTNRIGLLQSIWRIWHSEDGASWYIPTIKTNEMHYFSNLFDKVLYMFRTDPLPIIRSISTLDTQYMLLLLAVCCWGHAIRQPTELACIACIECWDTPDDGQ
jgi:hypothetical protein